jgi:hypothetical protein
VATGGGVGGLACRGFFGRPPVGGEAGVEAFCDLGGVGGGARDDGDLGGGHCGVVWAVWIVVVLSEVVLSE